MIDLFAIARANGGAIQGAFESLVAQLPAEQAVAVQELAKWVEAQALISINVKLLVVVEVLNGKNIQNIYEWAQEQSRLSGRTVEDALQERLGAFFERRISFDRVFTDAQRFRYGALNAGGGGLPEFGPYCVVLARAFQEALRDVACLPGDSLKICFTADGSFDQTFTERCIAPYTHCHMLVAKERAIEVPKLNRPEWPSLVGSADRYFEVIFIGGVSADAVGCVRVLKTEYDRMWDLAFANFGRKLGEAERALVQDFVQLRRAAVEGRIQVEVLG